VSIKRWTDAEIAKVRRFREDGLTAAQIAAEMGASRNAIIGMMDRNGIRPGEAAMEPGFLKKAAKAKAAAAVVRTAGAIVSPRTRKQSRAIAFRPKRIELEASDATPKHALGRMYCGGVAESGGSYCLRHRERSFAASAGR
jgi:hypothetical protein